MVKQQKISNYSTITIYNNDCSEEFAEEVIDFISSIPRLRDAFKRRFFVQPDPKDIFILALTELRDTGDIDCLIRALNWQQNTIDSLRCDLDSFHRTLTKLDTYRQEVARLKHTVNVVRTRNSELIAALKASSVPIPKSKSNENKKKNPCSCR